MLIAACMCLNQKLFALAANFTVAKSIAEQRSKATIDGRDSRAHGRDNSRPYNLS